MTLPNPGVSLSILQIYNEAQAYPSGTWYNKGYGLGAYRGVQWWKDDTSTGYFSSGAISINDFYSKRPTSPVTPGSQTFTSSGTFTVPLYSTLSVTIRGGSGGGGGASGNIASGGNGTDGGTSSFGAYGSGDYGKGGQVNAVNGAAGAGSDGVPAGGAGANAGGNGTNGGNGGAGGKTVLTLTNPISGGSGPSVGASVGVTVGGAGAAGFGGQFFNGFTVLQLPNGNNGSAGSVVVQWS